jgi:two-component system sensor histidine kinase ChvG
VRVTVTRTRPEILVRVEDDGPGVPPDNLETIFQRFYTSRPKGAAFGGNSGLGLAIARQIIESHGGRIWAENRRAADGATVIGASFGVALPGA